MSDFVLYPHAALSAVATPRPVDSVLRAAGTRLAEAAQRVAAYGIAAAHLGEPEPVVVISIAADLTRRNYRLLFNPAITAVSDQTAKGAEGSVSLPGVEVDVERPVWAEIAYDDADGIRQTTRLDGFAARVALHEIDQMNGIFFLARVSRLKRDASLRKFHKSQRGG